MFGPLSISRDESTFYLCQKFFLKKEKEFSKVQYSMTLKFSVTIVVYKVKREKGRNARASEREGKREREDERAKEEKVAKKFD